MQNRVLIVDSDISFVVKVKQALQAGGAYQVTVFATGQAALEHLARERQDVAVVDFALRDMDGPGLIEKIRTMQPDIAIVAIPSSVYLLPGWLKVEGSLDKPYHARDLDALLQVALTQQAEAPPAKTVALTPDESDTLDKYVTMTDGISLDDVIARQMADLRRQAEDLPKDPMADLDAPGADMSLEDLLETLAMTEKPPSDAALDNYLRLTDNLVAREPASAPETTAQPRSDGPAEGAYDYLQPPHAPAESEIVDDAFSDDWLATLVEGGPSLPGEVPAAALAVTEAAEPEREPPSAGETGVPTEYGTKVLGSEDAPQAADENPPAALDDARYQTKFIGKETPAPPDVEPAYPAALEVEEASPADDLDFFLALTEDGETTERATQHEADTSRHAPDVREPLLVTETLEAPQPESPQEIEDIPTDESFEDILALMEGRPKAVAPTRDETPAEVETPPTRRAGDTEPLPPLEDEVPEESESDAETALYLESFQETIAEIASRSAPQPGEADTPALLPIGALTEWERELVSLDAEGDTAPGDEAVADASEVTRVTATLSDEDEALWLSIIENQGQPPDEELQPVDLSGAIEGVGEGALSLDDLLNQIEQQIAEAAPERRPQLKKLPPRKGKSRRRRKERRPQEQPGRGIGLERILGGKAAEPERPPTAQPKEDWEPVEAPAAQRGELPDWLADEVPEDLRESVLFETLVEDTRATTRETAPAEPVKEAAATPPLAAAEEAPAPVAPSPPSAPALPSEPIILEPTLQRGSAYRTLDYVLNEEEPPPLPPRAPDEWQPAFPGDVSSAAPLYDEAVPGAMFVYPGRQALAPEESNEWEMVAPPPRDGALPTPVEPPGRSPETAPAETEMPPAGAETSEEAAPEPARAEAIIREPHETIMGDETPPERPADAPEAEALTHHTESARVALQLTHLAVESSAEALVLTRGRRLVGYAGNVNSHEAQQLAEEVWSHWNPDGGRRQTLVRFVRLDSTARDYIMYSIVTADDMVLSMAFPANTPLGQVRRHAREIAHMLATEERAPEAGSPDVSAPEIGAPTAEEPPSASPETGDANLHPAWDRPAPRAVADTAVPLAGDTATPEESADSTQPAAEPAAPDEAQQRTSYTCVWTLRDPRTNLNDEQEHSLKRWLKEVADAYRWRIQAADVRPEYINLSVEAPTTDNPSHVVEVLMDATSNRMLEVFANRLVYLPGQGLWADGYYVVTPSRPLTEREIARFINYQRREQSGA